MNPIRLALIGAGRHSRHHHAPAMAHYAREHPDRVELAAVCDLQRDKAQAFADAFGFKRVYTDYPEMIEKASPDACVCVMRIGAIAPLAIGLMQRGMPVTVEKPMGASLAEIQEIVKTARDTGTPNMVSVNRRFDPLIRRGIQWARAQGDFRYLRASILRHDRNDPTFVSSTAIHCIDTLRHIGGDITGYRSWLHAGQPHWIHARFTFESGTVASLDMLPTAGMVDERYEIFGDGFRVEACAGISSRPILRCWKEDELIIDECPPVEQPAFIREGAYGETEAFVAALCEGRAPWPSVGETYPSVQMAFQLEPGKAEGEPSR